LFVQNKLITSDRLAKTYFRIHSEQSVDQLALDSQRTAARPITQVKLFFQGQHG